MIDRFQLHKDFDSVLNRSRTKRTAVGMLVEGYGHSRNAAESVLTFSGRLFRLSEGFTPVIRTVRGDDIHTYAMDATVDIAIAEMQWLHRVIARLIASYRDRMIHNLEHYGADPVVITEVVELIESGDIGQANDVANRSLAIAA